MHGCTRLEGDIEVKDGEVKVKGRMAGEAVLVGDAKDLVRPIHKG